MGLGTQQGLNSRARTTPCPTSKPDKKVSHKFEKIKQAVKAPGVNNKLGFQRGFTKSPSGSLPTVQISSWVQVPEILAEIAKGNTFRLDFPKVEGDSTAEICEEQKAIREFFIAHHNKSPGDLREALIAKITAAKSWSNEWQKTLNGVDPAGLVDAYFSEIGDKNSTSLSVTKMYPLDKNIGSNDPNIQHPQSIQASFREIGRPENGPVVFTVDDAKEEDHRDVNFLRSIADRFVNLIQQENFSQDKVDLCKVWIANDINKFVQNSYADGKGDAAEMTLANFMEKYRSKGDGDKTAGKDSPSSPDGEGSEAATELTEEKEAEGTLEAPHEDNKEDVEKNMESLEVGAQSDGGTTRQEIKRRPWGLSRWLGIGPESARR